MKNIINCYVIYESSESEGTPPELRQLFVLFASLRVLSVEKQWYSDDLLLVGQYNWNDAISLETDEWIE